MVCIIQIMLNSQTHLALRRGSKFTILFTYLSDSFSSIIEIAMKTVARHLRHITGKGELGGIWEGLLGPWGARWVPEEKFVQIIFSDVKNKT